MNPHIDYRTHLDAARTAIGNSDYFTAERECIQAELCLAAMPAESSKGGNDGNSMKTRMMEELQQLLTSIRTLAKRDPAKATHLMQVVPLDYAIPGGVSYDW